MLSLISPAKINLFLKIVNRRPDGYHNLASFFQTITLADQIQMALSDQDSLVSSDPTLPLDRSNLIWKAVDLFRHKAGESFAVQIQLQKNIPQQAGLGGGSGNAATVLWGLNQLAKKRVAELELAQWSAEIGSDIPFFFSSGTAYCTNRGEAVESLRPLSDQTCWVVKPSEGLSTPLVFKNLQMETLIPRDPLQALQAIVLGKAQACFNDLESAAFRVLPPLVKFKAQLQESGFHTVVMTGSGSSFFCFGEPGFQLPNAFYRKVNFIQRKPNEWYQ